MHVPHPTPHFEVSLCSVYQDKSCTPDTRVKGSLCSLECPEQVVLVYKGAVVGSRPEGNPQGSRQLRQGDRCTARALTDALEAPATDHLLAQSRPQDALCGG